MSWWDMHVTRAFASQTARDYADLLRADPDGWRFESALRYQLRHTSGAGIWVGNRAYGLDVGLDGDWQVTVGGSASQRHVWRAYRRWRDSRGNMAAKALQQLKKDPE